MRLFEDRIIGTNNGRLGDATSDVLVEDMTMFFRVVRDVWGLVRCPLVYVSGPSLAENYAETTVSSAMCFPELLSNISLSVM